MNNSKDISAIEKKIVVASLYDMPGVVLAGLALYTKYGGSEPLHPLLENENIVNSLLVVGVAIMVWTGLSIVKLGRLKKQLISEGRG